ncbi:MAG: ATP-binding cassette domain-containing protein, partial [Candidatus Bathyarchaeia archaeon]
MVRIREIYKTFRSGRGEVKALQDLSFDVEEGKNLVIVGRSGSGKTTLLNCIGGLERVDRGSIT